jgi:hypothetical protein
VTFNDGTTTLEVVPPERRRSRMAYGGSQIVSSDVTLNDPNHLQSHSHTKTSLMGPHSSLSGHHSGQ